MSGVVVFSSELFDAGAGDDVDFVLTSELLEFRKVFSGFANGCFEIYISSARIVAQSVFRKNDEADTFAGGFADGFVSGGDVVTNVRAVNFELSEGDFQFHDLDYTFIIASMKVLVLAAGISKRMAPIGDKNFLNFLGKPLIWHQLNFLERNGAKEVRVVGSETNLARIEEIGREFAMEVSVCQQVDLRLGMAGAVLAARDFVEGDEEFVIFSGNDVVEDKAIEDVMAASGAESYLLGKKVESYFPGGYLEVEGDLIRNIVEKPGAGNEPSDLVNLVVHRHTKPRDLLKYLDEAKSEKDDLYEVALAKMMKDGVRFKAVPYSGVWQAVKYPWHVHGVFKFLFEQAEKFVDPSAEIAKSATIDGEVIIEKGVKILENAVLRGPVYLGPNCVVANNSLVRESHLGEGSVAGFNTEVARSYCVSRLRTHMNYVGDSVIEDNVSFGAGAVTGNLRLDEQAISVLIRGEKVDTGNQKIGAIIGRDVRIGVNTSIMPGVKIGSETFVGAGIVVAKDVEEGKFVTAAEIKDKRSN